MGNTDVAVTNIAAAGISVRVDGRDYFLPYEDFPWFENADAKAVRGVTRPGPNHLRWPDLDVDLAVDSLGDPVAEPAAAAGAAAKPAAKPAAKAKKPAAKPAKPKKPAAKPKKPSRR